MTKQLDHIVKKGILAQLDLLAHGIEHDYGTTGDDDIAELLELTGMLYRASHSKLRKAEKEKVGL